MCPDILKKSNICPICSTHKKQPCFWTCAGDNVDKKSEKKFSNYKPVSFSPICGKI